MLAQWTTSETDFRQSNLRWDQLCRNQTTNQPKRLNLFGKPCPKLLGPSRARSSQPANMWRAETRTEPLARSPSSALLPFLGEGSPTEIDYRKMGSLILTSLLQDLVAILSQLLAQVAVLANFGATTSGARGTDWSHVLGQTKLFGLVLGRSTQENQRTWLLSNP